MLRLNSEITIGNLRFNFVTDLRILTSWETITDTAIINLPNNLRSKNINITDIIQVNDPVTIKIGYHPKLETRFVGFVSRVVPESPMKIYCEDQAFKLKQSSIRAYSKKDLTLNQLITDNYDGPVDIADADIGAFRIDGVTLVKVLQELRSKYGLFSWFKDGILFSGVPFTGDGETILFSFQRNIIDGRNLRYTKESELHTVVHGISTQPDGKTIELYAFYEAGRTGSIIVSTDNPGGDLNKYSIPGRTLAQLSVLIKRKLPNLHYTGYRGSFDTFGNPIVEHGDMADITDNKFPERSGKYLVKGLQIDFGMKGYRQKVELDRIVS